MKACSRCSISKEQREFYRKNTAKDGLSSECKSCHLKAKKQVYRKDPEKFRQRSIHNRRENSEYLQEYNKQYRKDNPEYIAKLNKNWCENNRERVNKKSREWQNWKMRTDLDFRLRSLLRQRLYKAVRGRYRSGSAVRDLGCSIVFLKQHLKSQFQEGMSWDNYGSEWEIDHIKPLSLFDLSDRTQLLRACNWQNLQPLWVFDNRSKGNKYEEINSR